MMGDCARAYLRYYFSMTAPKVRADYDSLKQLAASFGGQAQAARQTIQSLQGQMDVLQGGDWIGQGATAFYQEMGGSVMPTLKRLAGALESAQQSTLQISQIMQQAEAEAARVLRGDGTGAGSLARPGGGLAGPGGGGGGGGGAGGGGAGGAGGGSGAGGNAAAQKLAAENAATDSMLSKFDPKVRALVKQSPTLRAELLSLQNAGYSISTGPVADGYYTNRTTKTIVIDQPLGDADTVSHIAHEVGHGTTQTAYIPPTPSMTKDQYVNANVNNQMHNEGEAQFNAAQVRAELKAAGGPDTGIPGSQTADYQKAYDDYVAGKITKDQAITQMGNLMGNEKASKPPYKAYRDYYGDTYKDFWDKNIAPTRKP